MSSRNIPRVIHVNVFLMLVMDYSLIAGVVYRLQHIEFNKMPEIMWGYNILGLLLIGATIPLIYGMFRGREWARIFTIAFDCIVIFLLVLLKVFGLLIVKMMYGELSNDLQFFDIVSKKEFMLDTTLAIIALICVFYLLKSKAFFQQHSVRS